MRYLFVIILFLFLIGTSNAVDPWSTQDKVLEYTFLTLNTIDWMQTREVSRNPDKYHEYNPILGRHPSLQSVDIYMPVMAVAHVLVTHFLPKKARPWFQMITIGASGACVINNFTLGIGVRF